MPIEDLCRSNASQRSVLRAIGEGSVQIWCRYRIIPCIRICSPPADGDMRRFLFARQTTFGS